MSKKMLKIKQSKGITLIALILIFIVLLIIAGIIATVITGDNGIISKTIKARDIYSAAYIKERVQLYLTNSYNEKGKVDKDVLKENLRKNLGVNPEDIEEDENGIWTFPVGDIEVTLDTNQGIPQVEDKTKDRQITIHFAYYSWGNKGQTKETQPTTVLAGDADVKITPPSVEKTKMMVNNREVTVTPKGWSRSEDGSTGIVAKNGEDFFVTKRDDDKTFYMIYTYTVTATIPDGNGNTTEKDYEVEVDSEGNKANTGSTGEDGSESGDKFKLPDNPTPPEEWKDDDVTFVEWVKKNKNTPEAGYKYVDSENEIPEEGDKYFPKFKRTITITFDVNGGERGNIPETLTGTQIAIGNEITEKAKITIPSEEPTLENNKFLGWYDKKSTEEGTKYECGQEYDTFEYSMTLYAIWINQQ